MSTPDQREAIISILGRAMPFSHKDITRSNKTRHVVTLEAIDRVTGRKAVGTGQTPEEAAAKAKEKIE